MTAAAEREGKPLFFKCIHLCYNMNYGMEEDRIMKERWHIYDCSRNKTGGLHTRGIPSCTGGCHMVIHIWRGNRKGQPLPTEKEMVF